MAYDNLLKPFEAALPAGAHKYLRIAQRYLKSSRGQLTRRAVDAYLEGMRREGYADGTIHLHFATIRRLFRLNGVDWPYARGEGPVVRERAVYAPALDPALVRRAIAAARAGRLDATETGLLALSTVYGMRRVELVRVRRGDIRLPDGVIYVETAKSGRQRYHGIPEEIADVLAAYPCRPLSPWQASDAWHRICAKAGIKKMPEVGWHSIRRILTRELLDAGIAVPVVREFLRWKRTARDMPLLYHSTEIVGEGRRVERTVSDKAVDERVFARHPFLAAWGERGGAQAE